MPKDDFDRIVPQIDGDTKRIQKELDVWKATITYVIAKRIEPLRKFKIVFEASIRRGWEAVKTELRSRYLRPVRKMDW